MQDYWTFTVEIAPWWAIADDEPPDKVAEAKCMAKKVTILRGSFLSMVLAAAIPAVWAADTTANLHVPVQNSSAPPTPNFPS